MKRLLSLICIASIGMVCTYIEEANTRVRPEYRGTEFTQTVSKSKERRKIRKKRKTQRNKRSTKNKKKSQTLRKTSYNSSKRINHRPQKYDSWKNVVAYADDKGNVLNPEVNYSIDKKAMPVSLSQTKNKEAFQGLKNPVKTAIYRTRRTKQPTRNNKRRPNYKKSKVNSIKLRQDLAHYRKLYTANS